MPDRFEVYALRLASAERPARDNFLSSGDRSGWMGMDFIMWIVRNAERVVAIDTGFNDRSGKKRQRTLSMTPASAVQRLGIHPAQVEQVVLTHLHYDHAGNLDDFPQAQIVLQSREMEYATGRSMTHPSLSHFFEVADVTDVVRRVHASEVNLIDGYYELAPGLELHLIGGHTRGLQVVRVFTERGWIVLASDALHYYENFTERNPFPAVVDLAEMLDGYDKIASLADSVEHIIPGHDPALFDRYCRESGNVRDIAALHVSPQIPGHPA